MGRKLYLDDKRSCPKGYEHALNFKQAVELYELFGEFDLVDLDYSLEDGKSGLDFLKWMADNGKSPNRINIHSAHIEGKRLMREYAEDNFFDVVITEY